MIRSGLTDPHQRRAFIYSVLRGALSIDSATAFCVGVNTARLQENETAVGVALDLLLERIELKCKHSGDHGLILMDEERKHDKQLRERLRDGSDFFPYDRIVDSIAFMPSEESPGIQVADLVAGSFARHVNQNDPGYLRTFLKAVEGYPNDLIGRGLKLRNRADRISIPEPRRAPWSDSDRAIHEFEMKAAGNNEFEWLSDGTPSRVFGFDSDSKK